jgi:hypothetical protein
MRAAARSEHLQSADQEESRTGIQNMVPGVHQPRQIRRLRALSRSGLPETPYRAESGRSPDAIGAIGRLLICREIGSPNESPLPYSSGSLQRALKTPAVELLSRH